MTTGVLDRTGPARAITLGAVAGLAGGLIFGIMMAMGGMLPMVAMLVGQESPIVGFIVHMAISAFIGAVFGLIAARLPQTWATLLIAGAVYGAIWWVLGGLTMMPLMLGMNEMVFVIQGPQIMSLVGHLVYGLVTAGAFRLLAQRA